MKKTILLILSALILMSCSSETERYMDFLYQYMPLPDRMTHDRDWWQANVEKTLEVRDLMGWNVPEREFRHFVMPLRVNNEELDDFRTVYADSLCERVKGMSMEEAALEINHWCHERATYRASDGRTSAPMATIRAGLGRCGEESVLAVAAMRAAGIPARQVYTPRWAHTDDNHAWVEVYVDGKWHFMGACEPEAALDMAWFNSPVSRAMLLHTKVYGDYRGEEDVITRTGTYTEINVIKGYVPSRRNIVTVTDTLGRPVEGAKVEFRIYNYAEFYPVASYITDSKGQASLDTGLGDIFIWASFGDRYGYCLTGNAETTLALEYSLGERHASDLHVEPPVEDPLPSEAGPEAVAANALRLAEEDGIRAARPHGQQSVLDAFKAAHPGQEEICASILNSLSFKDMNDVSAEVLEDAFAHAVKRIGGSEAALAHKVKRIGGSEDALAHEEKRIGGGEELAQEVKRIGGSEDALAHEEMRIGGSEAALAHKVKRIGGSEDALAHEEKRIGGGSEGSLAQAGGGFDPYTDCPRIELEMLYPYFGEIGAGLELADARQAWEWTLGHISTDDSMNPQGLRIPPVFVWRERMADSHSRDIFYVALCRSLGFPARIDEVTGKLQYRTDGVWNDVKTAVNAPQGSLALEYGPQRPVKSPTYYTHFTLSKVQDGSTRLLSFDEAGDLSYDSLFGEEVRLDEGCYMLTTGRRLSDGSALTHVEFFDITRDSLTRIPLTLRSAEGAIPVLGSFDAEKLYLPEGSDTESSILSTTGRGWFIVAVLGESGDEPSNHALQQLDAAAEDINDWGHPAVILRNSGAGVQPHSPAPLVSGLKSAHYGFDTGGKIAEMLSDGVAAGDLRLPVVVVGDSFGRIVYFTHGYNTSLAEDLRSILPRL